MTEVILAGLLGLIAAAAALRRPAAPARVRRRR
jgi:hypothetical protein